MKAGLSAADDNRPNSAPPDVSAREPTAARPENINTSEEGSGTEGAISKFVGNHKRPACAFQPAPGKIAVALGGFHAVRTAMGDARHTPDLSANAFNSRTLTRYTQRLLTIFKNTGNNVARQLLLSGVTNEFVIAPLTKRALVPIQRVPHGRHKLH